MTAPGPGKAAVERHDGVEQAIDRQALGLEVDAEIAGEEQVGLARLDRDAGGNPPAVEIPGVGTDVVLGDDPAVLESDRGSPSIARMRSTSINGSSGRRTRVGWRVDRGELGAEHRADRADGELEALGAVKSRPIGGSIDFEVLSSDGPEFDHQRFDQCHLKGEMV